MKALKKFLLKSAHRKVLGLPMSLILLIVMSDSLFDQLTIVVPINFIIAVA